MTRPAPSTGAVDAGDVAYRHANLYVNGEGTWAVYVLGGVDMDNQPKTVTDGVVVAQMNRWADMTGRTVRAWGVPLHFPVAEFARREMDEAPNPVTSTDPAVSTHASQLDRKLAWVAELDARRLVTAVAVRVTTERVQRDHLPRLLSDEPCPPPLGRVEGHRKDVQRITRSVARAGWEARPVSEDGLSWLMQATRGIGMHTPHADLDRWTAYRHGGGFDQPVTATAPEGGPWTRIVGIRGGRTVTSYVAVLRASIPAESDTDTTLPWLGWVDGLGPDDPTDGKWQAQWAMTMHIDPGKKIAGELEKKRKLINAVRRHYAKHDSEVDNTYIGDLARSASQAVHTAMHGERTESGAGRGQVFIIVSAESEVVLQAAVETVTDAAFAEQGVTLHHEIGQWADYRRAIVGNNWPVDGTAGHVTYPPIPRLGAAVPNASPAAGDPTGFLCGNPAGSNTAYFFDPMAGRRNGRAGVGVLAGAQGSGKTATAVAIADDLCLRGIPGLAFSPDAQIAQILHARHYQGGRGRVIPLTQVTTPGLAMPSLMVPEPSRDPGETDTEFQGRVDEATSARIRYERDWLTAVLPADMQRSGMGAALAIEEAVGEGGGGYGVSPWEHVARLLASESDVARQVGRVLTTRSKLPTGRLGFPDRRLDADQVMAQARAVMESDALFTCVTLPGIELPALPDRATWTEANYDAEPVLMAGLRLSSLALFADREPGWFIGDEIDVATGGASSVATFLNLLIYDIRRYNKWAALLVKSMSTLRGLDETVTALLGWAGVGRMGDEGAHASMPLLGKHVDPSLEDEIAHLDDGEWLFKGWDGRTRRVPFDQSWWHPDLVRYTDTKHGARPARLATPITDW